LILKCAETNKSKQILLCFPKIALISMSKCVLQCKRYCKVIRPLRNVHRTYVPRVDWTPFGAQIRLIWEKPLRRQILVHHYSHLV